MNMSKVKSNQTVLCGTVGQLDTIVNLLKRQATGLIIRLMSRRREFPF
jgi:hypothetical protein